ncbi:MAG: DegT/DnrJ/EryC1/StrS family aminotransferase [Deltaproteobacteria bacterium]|nr:DegT/DnrJ/EryC1/StrS family aminotransferase [Deltaproteobacteria bacterium]
MKRIPMLDLKCEYEYMKEDIDSAIRTCLEHQKWILGPEVKELENKIAEYNGVNHCIGVSSGTEALVLSLRALAIKSKRQEYFNRKDEIITTPFTFTATGDAILRAGATPVFVDIDPTTYNIDPDQIMGYLTKNPGNVVGILPVHLYGQPCRMEEIIDIAQEYDLFIVEDVAQAFGGVWKNRKLGSIGDANTFSFFPSKNLGGFGDGGMISTNDDKISELVRMLLKHGGKDKYNVDHIGYNARLDTLQAAVLLAKFRYIDEFNEKRGRIADIYNEKLSGINGIVLPLNDDLSTETGELRHVYHQYTIRVKDGKRDELQGYLKENGISTMLYYPTPLHKMKVFEDRSKVYGDLINTEQAAKEVLSLPVEPLQDKKDTVSVIDKIKGFEQEI